MEPSTEAQSLLIVGSAYLVIVAIWAWTLVVRSNILLRELGQRMDPELWRKLGTPGSMKDVLNDPEKRWFRFIRNREYRLRCSSEVVDMIDDFRHRQNRMLIITAAAGVLLAYRYWPLLVGSLLQ